MLICDHCEEEIVGDAICLDCLEIAIFENQVKKTPVELAAGDLLNILRDIEDRHYMLDGCPCPGCKLCERNREIIEKANNLLKALNNQSPQANPSAQDAHKSAP